MMGFIDEHRAAYGVEPIGKVLQVAPSTDYLQAARRADPAQRSARAQRDAVLMEQIQRVWDENFQVYGRSGGSGAVKALPWPAARWRA